LRIIKYEIAGFLVVSYIIYKTRRLGGLSYMAERLVGGKAPDFEMKTALGDGENFGKVSLSDYKGKWLILFFYPLDFTFI
jgi:hypothetical protein